jgi:hypothetical protein
MEHDPALEYLIKTGDADWGCHWRSTQAGNI